MRLLASGQAGFAFYYLQSSPTGPAEHCAGGSLPKSCNSCPRLTDDGATGDGNGDRHETKEEKNVKRERMRIEFRLLKSFYTILNELI